MRVLVTGAGGFVGGHIAAELRALGHAVTGLVRSPVTMSVPVVLGDVERDVDLGAYDALVHAALVWGEPGTEADDTAACERLFAAAGRGGLQRIVYISSTAVHRPYGGTHRAGDKVEPPEIYGLTKLRGELAMHAACAAYGMSGVALRCGPVVGPRTETGAFRIDGRLTAMVLAANAGVAVPVPAGARQFVDPSAVGRVVRGLLIAERVEATFMCVDARLTAWAEIADRVLTLTGSRAGTVEVAGEPVHWFDPGPLGVETRESWVGLEAGLGALLKAARAEPTPQRS